jgi:hypothetical protein
MSAILPINLTLYGQAVSGISIPIGSTVLWTLDIEDPFTRDPVDLTVIGTEVQMSLASLDARGNPVNPPIFSRQATIVGSPTNRCTVAWAVSDTVPSGKALLAGNYALDVWLEDGDGNRLQTLGTAILKLTAVATLPGTPVTPLPSQDPLGLGLPGINWLGLWDSGTTYSYRDGVQYADPNGGGSVLSSFFALNPAPAMGTPPLDGGGALNTGWDYLAERGAKGPQGDPGVSFPDQTGHAGQFLTTDGADVSWTSSFPDQSGHTGQFLQTDGSSASWEDVPPESLWFASVADMKASSGWTTLTDGSPVLLEGYYSANDGGGGGCYWDASSTETDDGGLIFQITGVTTGRVKRLYNPGFINVKWFGAKGTYNGTSDFTDDLAAFRAAIHSTTYVTPNLYSSINRVGTTIYVPKGGYFMSDELKIDRPGVYLLGASPSWSGFAQESVLFFDYDKPGLNLTGILDIDNYFGRSSKVENLTIASFGQIDTAIKPVGILMTTTATVKECYITKFAGHAIHVIADATADPSTNANGWHIERVQQYNCGGHGLIVEGHDVNAGTCIQFVSTLSGLNGIYDHSSIGGSYIGCWTFRSGEIDAGCSGYNINAAVNLSGCYSEANGGGTSDFIAGGAVVTGGNLQDGTVGGGTAFTGQAGVVNLQSSTPDSNPALNVLYNGANCASLNLATLGAGHCNCSVYARTPGSAGDLITVTLIGDSAMGAGVVLDESGNDITIHYESGVSMVKDVHKAIADFSTLIQVKTIGDSFTVLTAPGDNGGPANLTGALIAYACLFGRQDISKTDGVLGKNGSWSFGGLHTTGIPGQDLNLSGWQPAVELYAHDTATDGGLRLGGQGPGGDTLFGTIRGFADGTAFNDSRLTFQSIGNPSGGADYIDSMHIKQGRVGIGAARITPKSALDVAGAIATAYAAKTNADDNYAVLETDSFLDLDASGGNVTVVLPTAVGIPGRRYILKRIDSSINTAAFNTTSSQLVDGVSPPIALSAQNSTYVVVSDGANWRVESKI